MDYGDQFLVVWTAAAAAATSVQYVGARVHIGSFARPATHQRDVHQADEVVMSLFLLYGMHTNEGWGGGGGRTIWVRPFLQEQVAPLKVRLILTNGVS